MNYFDANIKAADQEQSTSPVNWRSVVQNNRTIACFIRQNLTERFSINLCTTRIIIETMHSSQFLHLVESTSNEHEDQNHPRRIKHSEGKWSLSILILWNRWTGEIWSFSQPRPLPDFSWRKRPSRRLRNWTPLFRKKRPSENKIWSDRWPYFHSNVQSQRRLHLRPLDCYDWGCEALF